jgi:quercetin dioxygenase-like cupin family protein
VRRWDLRSLPPSSKKEKAREPGADAPRVPRTDPQMPRVLFSSPECRAVVIDLGSGTELGEHHVRERAVVEVVTGRVAIDCNQETVECETGTLVTFDPGERHTVRALADARLLLLLAPWPAAGPATASENGNDEHLPANAVSEPIASPDASRVDGTNMPDATERSNTSPTPRRVIVVPTASVSDTLLQTVVWAHAGQDAQIHVIAPASKISRFDWLTNAEDDARGDALELAEHTAEAAPTENVEALVGDSDPLQAIEDALRRFPADELIIITLPDESTTGLETGAGAAAQRRFALPITHLIAAPT